MYTMNGLFDNSSISMARLYFVLSFVMLTTVSIVFPPFQVPDETDHAMRAYMLAHGAFRPILRPDGTLGGNIDTGLLALIDRPQRVLLRAAADDLLNLPAGSTQPARQGQEVGWTGQQEYRQSGAANYAPLVYVPQSIAILAGEAIGLGVGKTILAARLVNGLAAAAIVAIAFAVMPLPAVSILFILLLPKSLLQFASNSPDPIIHALTFSIIVFASRAAITDWTPRTWHYLAVAISVLALSAVRPPLAILAVLPFWVAWRRRHLRAMIFLVAAVVLAFAWFALVLTRVTDARCETGGAVDTKLLQFLVHGPALIVHSLWEHKAYYMFSFIAELGQGDGRAGIMAPLPLWVYAIAMIMLCFTLAHDLAQKASPPIFLRLLCVAGAIGIMAGIFFIMFLACTGSESAVIGGVQGRYFVSSAMLIAVACMGIARPMRVIERFFIPAFLLSVLANFITLISEGLGVYWISP